MNIAKPEISHQHLIRFTIEAMNVPQPLLERRPVLCRRADLGGTKLPFGLQYAPVIPSILGLGWVGGWVGGCQEGLKRILLRMYDWSPRVLENRI